MEDYLIVRVTTIDERDSTGLVAEPVFRAFDWIGERALAGETTDMVAYEIEGAMIADVLDWARGDRDPSPSLTEIYACVHESGGVLLVYLGSVARGRSARGDTVIESSRLRL